MSRSLREAVESIALYVALFAGMALSIPRALMGNPLFVLGTAVTVPLKLAGLIAWSWWAVTAPTWAPLALFGAHELARRGRAQRERRRHTEEAIVAAAEGRPMGVWRRGPDGQPADAPCYVGTSESCLEHVRQHAASGEEAARKFVVRALDRRSDVARG